MAKREEKRKERRRTALNCSSGVETETEERKRWKREAALHIDEFTSRPNPSCHCRPEGSSNPRTVVYDIDEKSQLSVSLPLSLSLDATWPISALVAVVPLRSPFLSLPPLLVPSWFHIDEFIAGTARSIVTKIVYDIDSSFYVNPVSEWFWSTCRGRAFCIRTRTRHERGGERNNVVRTCASGRRTCRVQGGKREEEGGETTSYRRIYEETDGTPKLTVRSVALCHRYANWAQLA